MELPKAPKNPAAAPASVQQGHASSEKAQQANELPSAFSQFKSNLAGTLRDNLNPMNSMKMGLYGAFGNNFLTRGVSGISDSIGETFSSLTSAPDRPQQEDPTSKILESLLKTMEENTNILKKMLQDGNSPGSKKESATEQELDPTVSRLFQKPQTIIKKTLDGFVGGVKKQDQSPGSKKESATLKVLKTISSNVITIKALLQPKDPISTTEDALESLKKNVTSAGIDDLSPKTQSTQDGIGDSSGWIASLTSAATSIIGSLKDSLLQFAKWIVPFMSDKLKLMKDLLGAAWQSAAKAAGGALDFVKGKGGELLEKGSKGLEKVGAAAMKVPETVAKFGGVKGIAKFGLKALGKMAVPITAGFAAYDGYEASQEAESILDIKGRKATGGEKVIAGAGGVVDSLTFGLLDKKKTANWINSLIPSDETKKKIEKINEEKNATKKTSSVDEKNNGVNIGAVNTTNNSSNFFAGRLNSRNEDSSNSRYLDRTFRTA